MNTPPFTPEAKHILNILSDPAKDLVMESIDQIDQSITGDDVLAIICKASSGVKDLMKLVKPGFMRRAVTIESSPNDGYQRRCIDDVIRGIKNCAFCLALTDDVLSGK